MRQKTILMAASVLLILGMYGCKGSHCAQDTAVMNYTVTLDTLGKYLEVELTYNTTPGQEDVLLKMPVWAPGYYMIQDFPQHLCDFSATGIDGKEIEWQKEQKNGWRLSLPADGRVVVRYRVFADGHDVASSRVDGQAAFIAPNDVFLYEEDHIARPVTVTFELPSNWKHVSTSLKADPVKACTYTAKDVDELYDSPLLMGNHLVRTFSHEGHDYELALETPDGYEESGFEECFRKIVSASTAIMQDVPYDKYTLIHMGPGQGGLEHLASQACYTEGTFRFDSRAEWLNYLAFTAHEYFHLYNVKTIRPVELGPFDYDHEVYCPLIWFSEGVTCYYEALILYRAGLATRNEMLGILSEYMRMDEQYNGHHHMSLRQYSYDVWLYFMNDDANRRDVRINYYFRGPAVGLIMDLEIARLSAGERSLDDLMRLLYNRYYHQQGRGFTEEEFWQAVDEVAGASMAHIRTLVDHPVDIDYEQYLEPAGLHLNRDTWTITCQE